MRPQTSCKHGPGKSHTARQVCPTRLCALAVCSRLYWGSLLQPVLAAWRCLSLRGAPLVISLAPLVTVTDSCTQRTQTYIMHQAKKAWLPVTATATNAWQAIVMQRPNYGAQPNLPKHAAYCGAWHTNQANVQPYRCSMSSAEFSQRPRTCVCAAVAPTPTHSDHMLATDDHVCKQRKQLKLYRYAPQAQLHTCGP